MWHRPQVVRSGLLNDQVTERADGNGSRNEDEPVYLRGMPATAADRDWLDVAKLVLS